MLQHLPLLYVAVPWNWTIPLMFPRKPIPFLIMEVYLNSLLDSPARFLTINRNTHPDYLLNWLNSLNVFFSLLFKILRKFATEKQLKSFAFMLQIIALIFLSASFVDFIPVGKTKGCSQEPQFIFGVPASVLSYIKATHIIEICILRVPVPLQSLSECFRYFPAVRDYQPMSRK